VLREFADLGIAIFLIALDETTAVKNSEGLQKFVHRKSLFDTTYRLGSELFGKVFDELALRCRKADPESACFLATVGKVGRLGVVVVWNLINQSL